MNSLGLDKAPGDTRVVVAMSGGVDSSATAAMLVEDGFEVIGVTLQLYDYGAATAQPGTCCAGQDIHDARRVADAIGIPHYVLDYEEKFRKTVIDDFADSYVRGETPIPCVRCNQTVKFRDMLGTARDLGADLLASGHYIRWQMGEGGPELHRGRDEGRDQSYFLFATTREQMAMLRFPLGSMDKEQTRAIARRHGLAVSSKPDSQDICFVPDGNYAGVLAKLRPQSFIPGDIVDTDRVVLGRHQGIVNFTVGQRRGLGIGGREPLYVLSLDADKARVVVGPRDALMESRVLVKDVNWIGPGSFTGDAYEITVKLRSAQSPVAAFLRPTPDGGAVVDLAEPQTAVAPGQACVFYDGDRLLGGGWITRSI